MRSLWPNLVLCAPHTGTQWPSLAPYGPLLSYVAPIRGSMWPPVELHGLYEPLGPPYCDTVCHREHRWDRGLTKMESAVEGVQGVNKQALCGTQEATMDW